VLGKRTWPHVKGGLEKILHKKKKDPPRYLEKMELGRGELCQKEEDVTQSIIPKSMNWGSGRGKNKKKMHERVRLRREAKHSGIHHRLLWGPSL